MIQHASVGKIRRPSNSSIGGPDNGTFIQCVDVRYPQIHELWCWDIDGICREVHTAARVDIPAGTVWEFVTGYLSGNGWCNQRIGELSISGSVQFIELSQIWGIRFPYIVNIWDTLRPQVGSVASMEILVPVPLVPEPSLESGVEDLLITL